MADSPVVAEALTKREPEPPAHDPIVSRSTSGLILVSSLLLTISLVWALYDEAYGQRPWKTIQRQWVARYSRYLDTIKPKSAEGETEVRESAEYQKLEEDAKEAEDKVKPEIQEIDKTVKKVQSQLDAVTEPFQNQRGRLTVIYYNVETASGGSKDKYRRQADAKRKEVVEVEMPSEDDSGKTTPVKMDYAKLETTYNELREKKAENLGRKAELLKDSQALRKKASDYLKNHVSLLTPNQIDAIKNGLEKFDYSILGHQVSVTDYNIADRCEVCHLGVRSPFTMKAEDLAPGGPGGQPDDVARAFVSHPDKELLEIHKPDRFGCSGCHWGNGRATTSDTKGHGRHKFWLWPMFEKENTEAGCQQCHAKDRVTQGASTLNLGRDLFSQRGCMGCHRYEGFDRETDALTNTRQLITQLEDQITANLKQISQDKNPPSDISDEEAQKLKAHGESLTVTNSLLAARIDQMNLQTKYLMQDQKKVGPNLKDVRLKLVQGWLPVWLKDPQAFRPGTKMPTFWRFNVDENGDDEIKAISAYLWQSSFDGKTPAQAKGDATKGKELFETKGCLACHSVGSEDSTTGGTFAANLSKVGEKANFDYVVRWIHNPRERWAPYCPKHKRDLTADDYKQAGKPFVFDTELNSKCPIDGAELQVQNMTVMPNFRLSEAEARDIATYLFSLSSPQAYGDVSFLDNADLKEPGRQLIKQFGCAGCHEIKGFEEEQRIGKELTVEGATPIERLDFALLTQDAEFGADPLGLNKDRKEKEWYNHKGFFEHKLTDPSIYDKGKEKDPKDRLRMPKPFLTDQWRNALTTFLLGSVGTEGANVPKSLFYDPQDQRRQDIQNGWWVIKKYNCMGCHQLQVGEKSVLMDLPQFQANGTPNFDVLPPRLTSEGARVDPNWLLGFLHDPSLSKEQAPSPQPAAPAAPAASPEAQAGGGSQNKYQLQPGADRNGVRPYLKVRMPTFNFSPNELQTLVRFFMAMSGQQEPYIREKLAPLSEQEKSIARQMFTSGTPCLKCHITGEAAHDASAIAPNFLLAGERLKPEWTFRWLLDPSQISPGTAMPSGLFKKDGERWAINLPNPPQAVNDYHGDHADLLVRYMILLSPDEQRRLLSTSPAPAAQPAAAQNAHASKLRTGTKIGWFRPGTDVPGGTKTRPGRFIARTSR
ncbi:MAG TPA: c-type cytochrome [Pyrinomonadaceae bacterium]|nr:c-type cytochrome [Pyrinomonadaceae bacterium]